MADKTLEQIKDEFAKISQKTQETYDALHGVDGRGIEQQFNIAKEKYDDINNRPESFRAYIKENYFKLKPQFEAAQKAYADAQNQKNALRKELKAAEKTAEAQKTSEIKSKAAGNVYTDALKELGMAETKLSGYKGKENYIAAYQKAQQAFTDAIASGKQVPAPPLPRVEIPVVNQAGTSTGTDTTTAGPEKPLTDVINFLADPSNSSILKKVQQDLAHNLGYTGNTDGKWSIPFQDYLGKVASQRATLPGTLKGTDLISFIAAPTVDIGLSKGAGAGGSSSGSGSNQWGTISNATDAKSAINNAVSTLLGRDATSAEVKDITKKLNDAQKANPSKQNAQGMTVGGLNTSQFITDIIKAMPEYDTKKQQKGLGVEQQIATTAMDNNVNASPQQISTWAKRVQNGEDIAAIQSEIRSAASLGYSDQIKKLMGTGTDLAAILSPYRSAMASTLGLNPETIKLDDPTLHQAIANPSGKEMNLFDYQTALRKDPRWQYTDQARSEASDVATKVLQDFGFMG